VHSSSVCEDRCVVSADSEGCDNCWSWTHCTLTTSNNNFQHSTYVQHTPRSFSSLTRIPLVWMAPMQQPQLHRHDR
jgi:hypothetical protein